MSTCSVCGRATDGHDRHVRFRLPEPVVRTPDQDKAHGTWKTAEDPNEAVMMMVPDIGAFVRALLPVRLTGGHTVTFGVWVGIDPDDLERAFETWWAPEYAELRMDGLLANALPGWQVLGAPVSLAVTDPDTTPYCVVSSDAGLRAVLTTTWDHDLVLADLPD